MWLTLFTPLLGLCQSKKAGSLEKPNIIFLYLDDLGYGDLSSYGATALQTPHIDKLANNGIRYTSAYASSSTCTPSRYALLTGEYPWRKSLKVLNGDAKMLIGEAQETLPKALKKVGYNTGIVGKWHLGLGTGEGEINWNETIKRTTLSVGFDYEYIMAATNDRVPTVYVENAKVVGLDPKDPIEVNYRKNFGSQPTGKNNPELLKFQWSHGHNQSITNGISRIGYMKGGNAALWIDEAMAEEFFIKACDYVDAQKNKEEPFFLYYAMHQPHVPRVPSPRFRGKSGIGPRGDVILEADWYVGQFIEKLEKEGLLENTLIVLSSDNGPVLDDGYKDQSPNFKDKHKQAGILKGGKYSLYEAGTRVPFITYWKGTIKPKVSDDLVSQVDLASSLAKLAGAKWVGSSDSEENLKVFLGKGKSKRDYLIQDAGKLGMRTADGWSFIPPHKGTNWGDKIGIPSGYSEKYQLYNLKKDPSQKNNLAEKETAKLKKLEAIYNKLVGDVQGAK